MNRSPSSRLNARTPEAKRRNKREKVLIIFGKCIRAEPLDQGKNVFRPGITMEKIRAGRAGRDASCSSVDWRPPLSAKT